MNKLNWVIFLIAGLFICSSSVGLFAQSVDSVSGKVKDAKTRKSLPAVNIRVMGTTTGTSTNKNGKYNLKVPH